jgi:hypothetical protein
LLDRLEEIEAHSELGGDEEATEDEEALQEIPAHGQDQ